MSARRRGIPGVRVGPWKLILAADPKQRDAPTTPEVQLYNLTDDLGETKNLATEQAERVAQMKTLFEKLITDGRSNSGSPQTNDVRVIRHPALSKKAAQKN